MATDLVESLQFLVNEGYISHLDGMYLLGDQDRLNWMSTSYKLVTLAIDNLTTGMKHASFLQQIPVLIRPSFGMNAQITLHKTDVPLVIIDDSLLSYLIRANLCFAETLDLPDTSPDTVTRLVVTAAQSLFDAVVYFIFDGAQGRVAALPSLEQLDIPLSLLLGQIKFIVLHEFGHYLNGDLDKRKTGDNHLREYLADMVSIRQIISLAEYDDELTYVINAAIPTFLSAINFADLVSSLILQKTPQIIATFTEKRFLQSHPDSDRRGFGLHVALLDSVNREMISDLPKGRPEWVSEEYRKMWNHGVFFGQNIGRAVLQGMINVSGLITTQPEISDEVRSGLRLIEAAEGMVIY